jgi:FSR family fosmidomycin resistance protein-like MFS transporter
MAKIREALADSEAGQTESTEPEPLFSQRSLNKRVIFSLFLIHFIGDFYAAFVSPLLPIFVDKFSLTLAQAGMITGISRLLAFIVQPPVGYLADHYHTRMFVLVGPLLAIVFISSVGIAPSFGVLLFFVALGSVGSSMFHPTAAGMVSSYSGPHFGLSMSIFNTGGTLAFGIGPILIAFVVGRFGLSASPFTMVFGLAVMVLLYRIVPLPQEEGLKSRGFVGSIREALGNVWKPVFSIWLVMMIRAFVGQSFITFIPVLYAKEGFSLLSIGAVVSVFTVAGALSGLIAGHLSDKIGYKRIFYLTHSLTTPCLLLLLFLRGQWIYLGTALAGFFMLATLPLGVAMAQQLAPRGKSMVSSLMMGLAFGTGGILVPLTGKLADVFSIRPVLTVLAMVPLLTVLLISRLPETKTRAHQTVI